MSAFLLAMPPKEKKEKRERRVGKRAAAKAEAAKAENGEEVENLSQQASQMDLNDAANNRSSTGVLTSEKSSRDIKVSRFYLD